MSEKSALKSPQEVLHQMSVLAEEMRTLCQKLDAKDLKGEILQSLQGFEKVNQSQEKLFARSEYLAEKITLLPEAIGNEIGNC